MTAKNFRVHNGLDVMGTDVKINNSILVKDSSGTLKIRNAADSADAGITASSGAFTTLTINGQSAASNDDATALAIALG